LDNHPYKGRGLSSNDGWINVDVLEEIQLFTKYICFEVKFCLLTESSEHTTEVHLCVNLSVDHEDLKAHFTRSPISKHFENFGILKLPDQNLGNS
jgi:hypothetical protein